MRLYALCDQDELDKNGVSIEKFIEIAKENGAEIIQYRNKDADISYIKQQLIKIRKSYDGFLIVNDAYELVEFCDGVHVGQEDLKKIDFTKKVAFLFGSEASGLSNNEVSYANYTLQIPTNPEFKSLNLSHHLLIDLIV